MEEILNITSSTLKLIILVIGVLTGFVPTAIAYFKNAKKAITAQTSAETSEALLAMQEQAQQLIVDAESIYAQYNEFLKENAGTSAGQMKKDKVLSSLQCYAIQNGYTFDLDYWNEEIDNIIDFTKKVNGEQETSSDTTTTTTASSTHPMDLE